MNSAKPPPHPLGDKLDAVFIGIRGKVSLKQRHAWKAETFGGRTNPLPKDDRRCQVDDIRRELGKDRAQTAAGSKSPAQRRIPRNPPTLDTLHNDFPSTAKRERRRAWARRDHPNDVARSGQLISHPDHRPSDAIHRWEKGLRRDQHSHRALRGHRRLTSVERIRSQIVFDGLIVKALGKPHVNTGRTRAVDLMKPRRHHLANAGAFDSTT